MSRLAAILGVTPATASGVIDRIERRRLAERRHRADDRRVTVVGLLGTVLLAAAVVAFSR